jgi:hypothetical protein
MNSQDPQDEESKPKLRLPEAAIIAGIPVLAYLVLFIHELGYLEVFGLPPQFISFDFAEVFLVSGVIVLLFIAVILVADMYFTPIVEARRLPEVVRRELRLATPIYLAFTALALIYWGSWRNFAIYVIAMLGFTLLLFGPAFLTKRGTGSYSERFEAFDELQRQQIQGERGKTIRGRLLTGLASVLGPDLPVVLIWCIVALFVIYQAGRAQALTQSTYRVANTSPETVVLYVKEDKAIVAPFDRKTHEIAPVYMILDYASNPAVEYRLERVGPLHLTAVQSTSPAVITPAASTTPTLVSPSATATRPPNVAPPPLATSRPTVPAATATQTASR